MSAGGDAREPAGRVVIGTLGLDQHEVGAVAVSRILMRAGYEVIYLGRFNTPERLVHVAEQEDAQLVGVSVHSWEWTAYADELVRRCHDAGIGLVVGGSVLTETDRADLLARGVDAVFGPYAAERDILDELAAVVARVDDGGLAAATGGSGDGVPAAPLAGRVVAVTGAAHGLGRAYALALVGQGAAVVANDLDSDALARLATAADATGDGAAGRLHAVPGDVSAPGTAERLLEAALSGFGQLHGLVSNAGVLRSGPLLRLDDADLRLLLDVHVAATFRLLRVAGRYWRGEAKAGRTVDASVVLTTSAAGLYGFRAEAAYSAAKAATATLTKVAADEFARFGTRVNAVAPIARTRLTQWLGPAEAGTAGDALAADRVAPVVTWLLSDAASTVTGRVLEVGGGTVSAPRSWEPGESVVLAPGGTPADVDRAVRQALAAVPRPPEILTADAEWHSVGASSARSATDADARVGQRPGGLGDRLRLHGDEPELRPEPR
jgi:methylmalonyl-CoA mutase cobalamin-binding domain/chain